MIAFLLAAALTTAPCRADGEHFRWYMKTRPAPSTFHALEATVADMLAVNLPPTAAKRAEVPVYMIEKSIIELTAYVRLVKLSPDDCDIHIQLSDKPDGHGPQVIAEIPGNQPEARLALEAIVGHIVTGPRIFEGDTAPRVKLTGWAFVDLQHAHKLAEWDKKGHAHGTDAVATLLEVHPVFKVEVAR
jgi:hypothetical protein